ncbi:MAG: Type 1 glutamine amidotransferase-like domain-containing protein [Desulfobacterales bacterium]
MPAAGSVVLMGSGELTATMVEVHKERLARLGPEAKAVFLDTPAGFQLNADQIADRARDYFRRRVGRELKVASWKSRAQISTSQGNQALALLERADYILIGPGSPTYALRHWRETPIPEILARRVEAGACLVAASAAALTVGRFTLPVYEIYKVGEDPRWEPGLDLLGRFELPLVVVPHWNNAEGGTHDTRFCFMGEPRFRALEEMLPPSCPVLGLDEHTACVLDLAAGEARVRGTGGVTLRRGGAELRLESSGRIPLAVLRGEDSVKPPTATPPPQIPAAGKPAAEAFWSRVHGLAASFQRGQDAADTAAMAAAVLELDALLWSAFRDLEDPETLAQGRELLREWIALLGAAGAIGPRPRPEAFASLVERTLQLREELRRSRRWAEADLLRELLGLQGIVVEDTAEGPRWHRAGGARP